MLHQLLSLLSFITLGVAAFGLGRPILRRLRLAEEGLLEIVAWSFALGLIAAGAMLFGLGLMGGLYAPAIGIATILACGWGLEEIRRVLAVWRRRQMTVIDDEPLDQPHDTPCAPPPRWLAAALLVAAGAACLGSLATAMAPPTSAEALSYYLEFPKTCLIEHGVLDVPSRDPNGFPLLVEMWYLWALAWDGPVCAQLVHWGLGLLLAAGTILLAKPVLGNRWAWIAGAVVVLTPGVNRNMAAPLDDVALAAFGTLALAAWWRGVMDDQGRRWLVPAGLAACGAVGVNPVGLLFVLAVVGAWAWTTMRRLGWHRAAEAAAVAVLVGVGVGGVGLTRIEWHFERAALAGSAAQLGALLVAALPGVLLGRRLRGLGVLLGVAAGYAVLWHLFRLSPRFLFAAVPPLAVAAVWVWIELRRFPRPARWAAVAAMSAAVALLAVMPLWHARAETAVAIGLEDQESYLLAHQPTYRAAAIANQVLSATAHVLSEDDNTFYFARRATPESALRAWPQYEQYCSDPDGFVRQLRSAGFTHLLLAQPVEDDQTAGDSPLARLADAQTGGDRSDRSVLAEYDFQGRDGTLRRYRLVVLR
jgi:hypothetical protein